MERAELVAGIEERGFAVAHGVLPPEVIDRLRSACDAAPGLERGGAGARNVLRAIPEAREAAASRAVRGLVEPVLGTSAFVTRAILFDKTPGANWAVPWHQDTTIAVAERRDAPGFGPWSVKAGVPHVQPPAEVLGGVLTVRIHLDDCGPENGPLMVLPGSHRDGLLSDRDIEAWKDRARPVVCVCDAGSAVLMRPLVLHASPKAERPGRRRVLHLEFAARPLPSGLDWAKA